MENSSQLTVNCSREYYNERRFVNVAVTAATSACVSFLVCLFAIFIIVLFKKWQSFGQRLIAYLLTSATLFSLATIIRRVDFDEEFTPADERFCTFGAFIIQITVWNLVDCIVAITVYLFLGVVCNKFTEKYELLYVAFIFVIPWTFGWIPFIHHTFGRAGAWCWIKTLDFNTCERTIFGQVLQLVMFYGPLLIILPSIIFAYLVMLCKLSKNRKRWKGIVDESDEQTNKIMKSETAYLLVYPLIFFALTLPILVARFEIWVNPQRPVLAIWYISVIAVNIIGAAFAVAFLLDKDTRSRLGWSHIRAAFKNYNATKGISEYATGDLDDLVDQRKKVPYRRMTNNSFLDTTTLEPL